MVLESLFNPFAVKKKPWEMFVAGFIYSIVGLMLSYFVFKEAAGLLTVFLIVLATVPLLYTTITNEEELDLKLDTEIAILKEHGKVLVFLIFLFLGIMTALTISYVMLPKVVTDVVFGIQQQAISSVNNNVQGKIASFDLFTRIFSNNLKVLFFCVVFSFLYGTGALFILTWNASVVATAMGNFFKIELGKAASVVGMSSISAYFGAASISFFRYMTHGIFEMVSYFVAGLAGGIISIALIKHNLKEDRVLVDALDLILLSLGILVIAGLVEVYITPVMIR
jgi:uncharacterized membrane protein SpoIIM required for sporulation